MAYIPATAIAPARNEQISATIIHAPLRRGTLVLNASLVAQTLVAAAYNKAGFTTPRPCAPMSFYTNPDGTVCFSRTEALAFDRQGFHS